MTLYTERVADQADHVADAFVCEIVAYRPRVQTASSGPGKCLCMKKHV